MSEWQSSKSEEEKGRSRLWDVFSHLFPGHIPRLGDWARVVFGMPQRFGSKYRAWLVSENTKVKP